MSIFGSNNDDIFRTQADPRFNSFAEPLNGVNTNQGAWGVDSNYLTPPYLSPFRPRYQGPTGNSYSGFRPSWASSFNQVVNPFASGGDNYGGNFMQQNSPYFDSIANRPVQGAMSFAQNLAIPGMAAHAAYKYWGGASTQIGRSIGERLVGGAFSGFGVSPGAAGTAMSMGQKAASIGIRAGGWMGGLTGGVMLPMAGVQAASWIADKAIFDPYISQRHMSNELRDNFQGVTFGDQYGNSVTGGGLSRGAAANIAKGISVAGAQDRTFTQNEARLLTDYASRSGMMDNAMPDQMVKRFEGIMKQVKTVMAIANTSDFKETIEIMSKMQMSGVSSPMMNGFMGALGSSASIAGQSVQKLMNTVGAQGQYLFGAQGLTPYVGMSASFNAAGSMFAAQRSGLLSPAMLARMGGAEGATQSSVAGMVGAYRTPYAGMGAFNQYMGGGATGDVVGNVSRFGASMVSGNMLQNYGRFQLSEGALTSRHIKDHDLGGVTQQVYELAKLIPGGLNSSGKVDAGVAHMIMTNQMGLSGDQSQALLARMHAMNDPATVKNMMAGNSRGAADSILKYQQQEGLNKGFMTPILQGAFGVGRAVQTAGARAVGTVNEIAADVGDKLENTWVGHLFGYNGNERATTVDQIGKTSNRAFDLSSNSMQAYKAGGGNDRYERSYTVAQLEKINKLAAAGNKDAQAFIEGKGNRKDLAYKLATGDANGIDSDFGKSGFRLDALIGLAGKAGVTDVTVDGTKNLQNTVGESLNKILSGKDVKTQMEYLKLMDTLDKRFAGDGPDSKSMTDAEKAQLARLTGKDVKDINVPDAVAMAEKAMKSASETGAWALVNNKGTSLDEIYKEAQNSGGVLLGGKIPVGLDAKAARAQREAQQGYLQQRNKIQQMAKDGKIDTNAAMGAINALDTGAAVTKFDDAVNRFSDAVNTIKKDDKNPTVEEMWNNVTSKFKPRQVKG